MTGFSVWLESTSISKALFGMSWLWPACESLHFVGLCVLIGGAGLLDLRLMGLFRGVSIRDVKAFMPWAIGGFVINLTTGLLAAGYGVNLRTMFVTGFGAAIVCLLVIIIISLISMRVWPGFGLA